MSLRRTVVQLAINAATHVVAGVLGFGIAGLGAMILVAEMKNAQVRASHIYVAAALVFFGALLIVPSIVVSGLRQVVIILGPFIPGGRRATDPPATTPTPDETARTKVIPRKRS